MSKKKIKGYKVFNHDLQCRGFQYAIGKTYTHKGTISLFHAGFHFCVKCMECFSYYLFDPNNRVCEVETLTTAKTKTDGRKMVTDKIRILRELSWAEVLEKCNTGYGNTGCGNTGDSNIGNLNTGYGNTGDRNTGYRNTGNRNTGNRSTGDRNTGDRNTGYRNTGCSNTGTRNTGNRNAGNRNAGNSNIGNWNTGHRNTGSSNTGYSNAGHGNAGNRNAGSSNAGSWNTGNFNSGLFNTDEPYARMFNKPTSLKLSDVVVPDFFYFDLTEYVTPTEMTEKEKKAHPEYQTTGGYLRVLDYKSAWRKAWDNASVSERRRVLELPNFDNDIFLEITGIDVMSELAKERG